LRPKTLQYGEVMPRWGGAKIVFRRIEAVHQLPVPV
jgi:hypothetical protein